ncbi:hypothetical protein AJ80_05439 [Polytolypa hystricis UAMH7299]|uniref:Pentatricopeptide repeat-containing protein-mitochondrial domain-containing protein n=1 Tax=Polytolypa hystricis (strain UAMH7299) TaxID=1447883 RepID=A0A2B7Y3V8_POLH7|nr:hypothetical protein AJ80_05439 [Polytolypa hystricis UAMH7299]
MPRGAIVADGLWRCLCPSFNQAFLNRFLLSSSRNHPPISYKKLCARSVASLATQPFALSGPRPTTFKHSQSAPDGKADEKADPASLSRDTDPAYTHRRNWKLKEATGFQRYALRRELRPSGWRRARWVRHKDQWIKSKIIRGLRTNSTENLERTLRYIVLVPPCHSNAMALLRELIYNRGVKPSLQHYRAMILANCDAYLGTPSQVRNILEEMEENQIPLDSNTLHAVLKVLAIHPDHLLRQEILQTLRDRWLPLSPAGWQHVIIGLVRERQYELALDTVSRMEAHNVRAQEWLYSLLIYNLCDAEEYGEMLKMMKTRVEKAHFLSPNVWFKVLDAACDARHEPTIEYVWNQRVKTSLLVPSFGMCSAALATTSRSGNITLADSVIEHLGTRKAQLLSSDYDSLIDTYAQGGDIEAAFRCLCIMTKATLKVEQSSTRSLYTALKTANTNPKEIWALLKRLRINEKRPIPLAAVNLVLELCLQKNYLTVAKKLYKDIHTLCPTGPDTSTFNLLFRGCRNTNMHDEAGFFLDEMNRLRIMPDRTTYETLVLLCVDAELYEGAYKYFLEMVSCGFGLTEKAKIHVRTKCFDSNNKHAKMLQTDSRIRKPIVRRFNPGQPQRPKVSEEDPQPDSESASGPVLEPTSEPEPTSKPQPKPEMQRSSTASLDRA